MMVLQRQPEVLQRFVECAVRDCLALILVEGKEEVLNSLALAHDLLFESVSHFVYYLWR